MNGEERIVSGQFVKKILFWQWVCDVLWKEQTQNKWLKKKTKWFLNENDFLKKMHGGIYLCWQDDAGLTKFDF